MCLFYCYLQAAHMLGRTTWASVTNNSNNTGIKYIFQIVAACRSAVSVCDTDTHRINQDWQLIAPHRDGDKRWWGDSVTKTNSHLLLIDKLTKKDCNEHQRVNKQQHETSMRTHCCVNIAALMEDKQNNRAGCGWEFLGNTLRIIQQAGRNVTSTTRINRSFCPPGIKRGLPKYRFPGFLFFWNVWKSNRLNSH